MTEVLPICNLHPCDHKRAHEASTADIARMGTAGKVHLSSEVFIEDMDRPGSSLPPPPGKNGVGQICARGPIMMKEYFKNPEKTKEAMPDGKYVRTGDIGKLDQNGYVTILGRVKDIIPTYRGFNIAPRDLEEVCYAHPSVGEAAVVGLMHPCGAGEMVSAWVTPKRDVPLTAEELRLHFEKMGLPAWQMPELFNVGTQQLPTHGGKVARKALQSLPHVRQALLNIMIRNSSSVQTTAWDDELMRLVRQMFNKVDRAGKGYLDLDDLVDIFDERAPDVLQWLKEHGSVDRVALPQWTARLQTLPVEDCRAWLLQLGSVHASNAKDAFYF